MTGYPSQMLYIPLVGGLDTKSDEKTVLPQDLVRLENGDYTEGGSLRFRAGHRVVPGYDQDGNVISGPVGLGALDDSWVMFTRRNAYLYDDSRAVWSNMGPYCGATHTLSSVAATTVAQSLPALATASGVTAVAWEDSRGGIRCSVYNEATGAPYVSEFVIAASNAEHPRVVAAGPNLLVAWFDPANDAIKARVILASDPAGTVQDADVVLADVASTTGVWDIVSGNNEAHLAFTQDPAVANGVVIKNVNPFGVVTRTRDADNNNIAATSIALAFDPSNDRLWLVYYETAVAVQIRSYTASTLAVLNISSYATVITGPLAVGVNEIGGISVWYDVADGSHTSNDRVEVIRRTSTGAASSGPVVIRHAKVATSGWFDGFSSCCVLWYETSASTKLQSTYFPYRDDGVVFGRMLYGSADTMTRSTVFNVSRMSLFENDTWQCALAYRRQVNAGPTAVKVGDTLRDVFEHRQIKRVQLNMAAPVSTAELDGVLYASGSMLWAIDGFGAPVESSPLLFPDMTDSEPNDGHSGFDSGGAGVMSAGTMNYRLYYEFQYGRHKRARSAAIEVQYTGGASEQVDITYPTLTHTRYTARAPVSVVGYRSEANKADFYYRFTDADPTVVGDNGYEANVTTANTGVITDNLADATLISRELDYRSRGEIVHFAPDGPSQLTVAQNRLFCVGGGERPNTVQYSFSTLDGAAVEFTDTSFLSELPEHGGDVVAMSRLDDVPVVLFKRGIALLDGVGYTNTGFGAQYVPAMVSSDVGCANPRAVVPWDKGVLFQSEKGLYAIATDGTVSYVGPGVEQFNAQRYTGAAVVPDTNMVLFLGETALERTAMFDYFYGKWGTYAQHFGIASATTSHEYGYLRSDGSLFIRDPSTNQDGASYFPLRFKTGPARTEGLEAAYLLRAFQLLGDYKSSHKIEVSVYYDNAPYALQKSEWLPDNVLNFTFWGDFDTWGDFAYWFGDSPYSDYHFERRFKRSRARAVQFEITVTPLASPGSSFEATEIAIEVAALPGPKRLARTRKV